MKKQLSDIIVLIRSAGELASGIAHRLHQYRFKVCLTEMPLPLAVSRGNTYSEAIFEGTKTIQGITAEFVRPSLADIERTWQKNKIPLIIDPKASIRTKLQPDVLVDATMIKKPADTRIDYAPLVIGVGPGFNAGKDVHVVIESNNGLNLGKLVFEGEAEKDTGVPVAEGGLTFERVLWASCDGIFTGEREIGDSVQAGERIAKMNDIPITAPVTGKVRGILHSGLTVTKGCKLIEIDPINETEVFYLIRDKTWKISGSVAETILQHYDK